MKSRAGNGAVEAAAAVDERNGSLAHSCLENASRFPQLPQPKPKASQRRQRQAYYLDGSPSRPHLRPAPFWSEEWGPPHIDIRRPFGGPEQVVNYFARYVRKIAISDHRLLSYDGHTVLFRYRDRADGNRTKTARVEAPAFCRRFLQHVLPPRFVRIRRYGLLSNRVRKPLLAQCRELLGAEPPPLLAPPGESRTAALRRIFGVEPDLCPACKPGKLIVHAQWRATRVPLDAVLDTLSPRAP